MQADVDAWMPKHFDDSLVHPAVTSAANYRVLHDYQTSGGLPSVFNGQCKRFIVYVASDIAGLLEWLDSPQIRGAIEDGREREGQYPEIEGEQFFVGNIYEAVEVRGALGRDFAGEGPIVAERFEVGEADRVQFDTWLNGPHLDAMSSWPGVVRVRTWKQKRDVPQRFPYTRYIGKGNRMISAEFSEGSDLSKIISSGGVRDAILDSVRWDVHLPYVRREAALNIVIRYP